MHQMWRRRLAAAMVAVLTGDVDHASQTVAAVLREADLQGTDVVTGAQFVGAFAAMREADHGQSVDFAEACARTARELNVPGWEACALALRVMVQPTGSEEEQTLESLVGAEAALQRCTDEDLRWIGHLTLGRAYKSQRLFELAIVHQQAALENPDRPFGLRASRMLPLLHLGETHLHWADELEQLGEPTNANVIEENRLIAAELARTATEAGDLEGAGPTFMNAARVLELSAAWEDDPVRAAAALTATMADGSTAGLTNAIAEQRARLAQIYAAMGKTERAIECVWEVLSEHSMAHDPRAEARVRFVAVSLAAKAGDHGSRLGLEYAQLVARSWWTQRLSKLQSVRRVLANEDLVRRNHRYKREAREDPLTGVGNRRALAEHLTTLADTGDPLSVVLIDVDDFKTVNDTYGHNQGDEALRAVADLLTGHLRDRDLVARIGGDEFAVALHAADQQQTTDLVDRLRVALLDFTTVAPHEHLQALRLSFGWASTSEGIAVESLNEHADVRMYREKRAKARSDQAQCDQTQSAWAAPQT